MKTKSGIYVDVSERPGEIVISVRSSTPASESAARTLSAVINGLVWQRPLEIAARGFITGTDPGWSISLKPLGAKRAADGLRPIAGVLTVEEARTLRGLLRDARRWAEHPPMLTYVDPAPGRALAQRLRTAALALVGARTPAEWIPKVREAWEAGGAVQAMLDGRTTLDGRPGPAFGPLTRSRVTRKSLEALRAAPLAAPETDASEGDPDLRWARPGVHDAGHERVWEPCKPTDDGAVLVVLP